MSWDQDLVQVLDLVQALHQVGTGGRKDETIHDKSHKYKTKPTITE